MTTTDDHEPRVLLFTGDGKGKTTAALGLSVRALGHGLKVLFVQFIKADDSTGEIAALERFDNLDFLQTGLGFLPPDQSPRMQTHRDAAATGLKQAEQAILQGRYDVVVLDEVAYAVSRHLIDERQVVSLARRLPSGSVLVMTGRGATQALIDIADTVSEIHPVKHAFQQGRPAKVGVER